MIGKQILKLRDFCCRITASVIGKSPDIHACRYTGCIILICGCGLCRCSRLDNAVYCHQPPGFVILPYCAGSLHSININLSTTVITCRKSQDNITIPTSGSVTGGSGIPSTVFIVFTEAIPLVVAPTAYNVLSPQKCQSH